MYAKRRTKNPIIWFQYLCWNVQFWMFGKSMAYPIRLRRWFMGRYSLERLGTTQKQINIWKSMNPNYVPKYKPTPWYVREHALGPFYYPWKRLTAIVRKGTGGRSHRCEFTDEKRGALYGSKDGGFMNEYFEQFIQNISRDLDVKEHLEEKYDQFNN